jgi:hypothetical protein
MTDPNVPEMNSTCHHQMGAMFQCEMNATCLHLFGVWEFWTVKHENLLKYDGPEVTCPRRRVSYVI